MADPSEQAWGAPVNTGWIDIQKRTFTKWCNSHLKDRMLKINNIDADLEDGVIMCALLEQISAKNVGIVNKKPKIRAQKLENNGAALKFLKDEGIKSAHKAFGGKGFKPKAPKDHAAKFDF